ncbi:MAG: hypothetical protein IRY85_11325 [Micromonosporaceae bacterium]|nr:hypothetical protein [Micromonosporaceae bacterium]
MIDDLLRSVTELTHRLRRMPAVLTAAAAQARGVCDGTDSTGSITIVIDDDGTVRDVHVAADWRRRLSPADVGPAVVAADAAAARRRAVATVEALADAHASVGEGAATDLSSVDGQGPPIEASPTDPAGLPWPTPVPTGTGERPRPLADLTAAVLAAVDDFDRVTAPPSPVVGIGAEGAVHVTVAQGRITECTVNQAWLARQDEVTLAHALREAIGAAGAAALAARRPYIDYQQRLETLVAEARASLDDLSRGPRP